ncbi:MAG: DUF2141 domain-containing protein [Bacteroidia bacterium]|nr:DUF2141 domain-containing protein [Bacteroidia bacterium]
MKLLAFLFLLFMQAVLSAQNLKISITGLRSNSGSVILGFYINDQSFEDEKPLFSKTESKAGAVNHTLTLTYTGIKPGTYGVVLLDDENNNGKMDFGWLLPQEGYGFSNYYHTGLTKPKLTKFSFVVTEGSKAVEIKVKYM